MMRPAEDTQREALERFTQMYEVTLPLVYGFLIPRVGGNRALAEDLTAETYSAAVVLFKTGRSADVTVSWLRTVARRRLIDHWRRSSVAADNVIKLVPAATDPSEGEIRADVAAALAAVSEAQRQALVLQHLEGYSVAEVAEILGRTTKGTESLLTRARVAFRQAFEEEQRA
jgi:RNA polymerase sigma-70 factor (ECF subfamily)